ncbi:hypothetical protein AGMMS49579_01070 [Spirochaetia bacterium]|nr:hypothetical protein AGMMS49579_01070 [Spirochaetia bacterium]
MASKYIYSNDLCKTFDKVKMIKIAKSVTIKPHIPQFLFVVKYYDSKDDLEMQKFAYSDDINKILYEPTNKIMSLYEIMKQPYVLSVHVSDLQTLPKFRVVFGKEECNSEIFERSYCVPKLNNVFLLENHVYSSKLVKNYLSFVAADCRRYLIEWNYDVIKQHPSLVDHDKVISEDKVGSEVCKVCMTNGVNTLFKPCMHAASCQKCSIQLNECHICKSKIKDRVLIFLS